MAFNKADMPDGPTSGLLLRFNKSSGPWELHLLVFLLFPPTAICLDLLVYLSFQVTEGLIIPDH